MLYKFCKITISWQNVEQMNNYPLENVHAHCSWGLSRPFTFLLCDEMENSSAGKYSVRERKTSLHIFVPFFFKCNIYLHDWIQLTKSRCPVLFWVVSHRFCISDSLFNVSDQWSCGALQTRMWTTRPVFSMFSFWLHSFPSLPQFLICYFYISNYI